MKKIVGIIAAVAMAASVFAVDMSAGTRLSGDIFTYDGASKTVSALKVAHENQWWHKPVTFSISSSNAGAVVKFTEAGATAMNAGKWNIWFKPVDAVKIDLGTIDDSMNTESIDWGGRVLNYDSFGFRATCSVSDLTLKLALVTGEGNNFFSKADGADAVVGKLNVAANYNAGSAGTISAMFDADKTFDEIAVAAGYKNSFGAVTVFADYAFVKAAANSNIVDFDAVYADGPINAQAYVKFTAAAANTLKILAKVNYALDNGVGVYGKVAIDNALADTFDATFTLGATGSVGIMSYEVAPAYSISGKKFSVPFNVAVSF